MTLAEALIANASMSIERSRIDATIGEATEALLQVLHAMRGKGLSVIAEDYALPPPKGADGWSLPDAVWLALDGRWRLGEYPLGAAIERAVKKSLAGWMLAGVGRRPVEPPADLEAAEAALLAKLGELGAEAVARSFVANCLFEICVDHLRRPHSKVQYDEALRYHFDVIDRHLLAPEEEAGLRRELLAQCRSLAAEHPAVRRAVDAPPARASEREGERAALFVNVIVGGRSPQRLGDEREVDPDCLRLAFHGKSANASFHLSHHQEDLFEALGKALEAPVPSLCRDLLDLGAAVFMADLHTRREHNLERRLGLYLPVRVPESWKRVSGEIERTISLLGRDHVELSFGSHGGRPTPLPTEGSRASGRCVVLLSGGLDSAAGALWALDRGLDPILVSHYANTQLAGIQHRIVERLERHADRPLTHLAFFLGKTHKHKGVRHRLGSTPSSVMAQHLRSFLYLSLASAVALSSDIDTVYIFENGPLAINPSISEARVNTRTTYPHVLAAYRDFVRELTGTSLKIENPFLHRTKGEVVRQLISAKAEDLLAETVSCWTWFRVPKMARDRGLTDFDGHHCGVCLPCVIRRVAVAAASLGERDGVYLDDVFSAFPNGIERETFSALADLLRFSNRVLRSSEAGALASIPELSIYGESDSVALSSMLRRHAEEVMTVFSRQGNLALQRMFSPLLPPLRSAA